MIAKYRSKPAAARYAAELRKRWTDCVVAVVQHPYEFGLAVSVDNPLFKGPTYALKRPKNFGRDLAKEN